MHKTLAAAAAVIMCAAVFAGCGNSGEDTSVNTEVTTRGYVDVGETKSKKFLTDSLNASEHPVRIVFTIESMSGLEEENIRMELGMTGADYYVETNTPEAGHTTTITKGNELCSVSHDDKTAIKITAPEGMEDSNPLLFMTDIDGVNLDGGDIAVGQDEVDGKTYAYEEFSAMDKTVRLLFEGDTCKAIKTVEDGITEVILIEEYDTNVDGSKFEIPEGYVLLVTEE